MKYFILSFILRMIIYDNLREFILQKDRMNSRILILQWMKKFLRIELMLVNDGIYTINLK